ncbi:hypothetical protein COCVIDRAFT_15056 [Bipolaris victoriae FI3]|uniref:Uncharacterized protein n=1 Tax=Bipolaris victoriae (strain FI3) TaxID=930091 RepID=W7EQ10_BIPV3|nr:hypothetical protein COCVIDRAFT_15056 [Bipolaris victoriae FI3]
MSLLTGCAPIFTRSAQRNQRSDVTQTAVLPEDSQLTELLSGSGRLRRLQAVSGYQLLSAWLENGAIVAFGSHSNQREPRAETSRHSFLIQPQPLTYLRGSLLASRCQAGRVEGACPDTEENPGSGGCCVAYKVQSCRLTRSLLFCRQKATAAGA